MAGDEVHGNTDLLCQLTRSPRRDGKGIHWDNIHAVTPSRHLEAATAQGPRAQNRCCFARRCVFQTAMENNIAYLLDSYSTDDLLRQFYERTGKVTNFKPTGSQAFWEEDLAGSNAARFLMGVANTLRWIENSELRRRMDAVVDGIEECRLPIFYYP